MAMNHWRYDFTDAAGNLQTNVQVQIARQSDGQPAIGYADTDGATSLGSTPTFADGRADIYLPGGVYKFVATAGGETKTFYNVHVGNASGVDVGVFSHAGYTYTFETGTTAPPSANAIRFDNADLSAATAAYIADETLAGIDIAAYLLALAPVAGNTNNELKLADPETGETVTFQITGTTDETGYTSLALSSHSGATSMPAGSIKLNFAKAGAKGAGGAAATIAVGTVSTVAAGQAATVTNVGTSGAAEFDFEIPEGDQGDPGDDSIVTGTSITSVAIGTGTKGPFTTQAGIGWAVGARVRLASAAGVSNFMEGVISAYSGTSLTVTVDNIGGSGTLNDWNISIAGEPGAGSGDTVGPSDSAANEVALFDGTTGKLLKRPSTGAMITPVGTEAQRPTGAKGMLRFNDDTVQFEGHDGSDWSAIGGAGGNYDIEIAQLQMKAAELSAEGWAFGGGTNGSGYADHFDDLDMVANSSAANLDVSETGVLKPTSAAVAAEIDRTDTDSSTSSETTYSFTGVDIGVADADRVVIVAVGSSLSAGGRSFSGVTIGGVTATSLATGDDNEPLSGIFAAELASGTTATIAVTFDGAMDECGIQVYRALGVSLTPVDTAVDTTSAGTASSMDTVDGGVVLITGTSYHDSNPPGNVSFSGITEDVDETFDTTRLATAIAEIATGTTNQSFSASAVNPRASWVSAAVSLSPNRLNVDNLTVASEPFTADTAPDEIAILLLAEEVDAATVNSDYEIEVTRDGSNWASVTLEELLTDELGRLQLWGVADVSAQPSDTAPQWRNSTTGVMVKNHATNILWRNV